MMKKMCLLLSVLILLFSISPATVFASEEEAALPAESIAVEIDYASAVYNADGTISYDIVNKEALAAAWGIDIEKVRAMKFLALPVDSYDHPAQEAGLFQSISIQNVTYRGQSCYTGDRIEMQTRNMSDFTVTKSVEISLKTSHTYSTSLDIGVSVEVLDISTALGFSVTQEVTITETTQVVLGPWESATVFSVPLCELYSFDVYQWKLFSGEKKVGTGYAYKMIGLCTTVYEA